MVSIVEGRMVPAQVEALETKSDTGREMVTARLLAEERRGHSLCPEHFFPLHSTWPFPVLFPNLPHHLPSTWLASSGLQGHPCCIKAAGSGLDAAQQQRGPKPSRGRGWCFRRGKGLAPRSQHRMQERKERIFSFFIPPGRDMSSSSSGRNNVRGLLLCRSLSAGALQRAALRGGGDQR